MMPKFHLYTPNISEDKDVLVKNLYKAYEDNTQLLQWLLSHLNQDNIQYFNTTIPGVGGAGPTEVNLFNEHGLNPDVELWSPNMWCNSDFCVYDTDSLLPRFISDASVEASDSAVFVGQKSMKIPTSTTITYTPEASVGASTINPQWLTVISDKMYLAFYAKFTGGNEDTLTVEVYDQDGAANLTIEDTDGNSGTSLTFTRSDWDEEMVFVKFDPGDSTDIRPKITNNSTSYNLYINAPQCCADKSRSIELMYLQSIYVQKAVPDDAVDKDIHVDIDNPTIDDGTSTSGTVVLTWGSDKHQSFTATSDVTLPDPAGDKNIDGDATDHEGIVMFCLKNVGSDDDLVTIDVENGGTIDGESEVYLSPTESITVRNGSGSNWEVV